MPRIFLVLLLAATAATAQDADRAPSAKTFNELRFRPLGPALASGRVTSFAVHPGNPALFFAGVASGGVWKTTNAGTTWTPVFDKEGSYSIGTVVLDPKDPNVVWVGAGENNSQRSVGYGDGVYRSADGGRTWRNLGLKASAHIGRIVIDPRDSNVVYVAAQGPLWSAGGDRGLYKTTDGGANWTRILEIDENTGVTDIALDPSNPDVILAASWQRRRHVWTLINGGPGSALHKSTDAGKTWRKLATGLPTEQLGRIGLAFSPARPGLVYARVEAANSAGGVFRSLDAGESWEKRNGFDELAMYYGQIIADPRDPDRIFVMATNARISEDGGKTLRVLGDRNRHVDTHTVWVDPANTAHLITGCDGGIYESWDRGAIWQFKANLPVTQFYRVAVDNDTPFYNVCGGTQDNQTLCGPSRTRSINGIVNGDWFVATGGDGFHVRIDPADPNVIYAESQYGGLVRYDKRTGERIAISPIEAPGEAPLRWNWDSPLVLSPHDHRRIYFAANRVYRSGDRGDSWRAVSPDLTRALDRNQLPVMGRVWEPDAVAKNASTSLYSNITALSESPRKEGLLYAGTDDGRIQVTADGGATAWKAIDSVPGVPERTYVAQIAASLHQDDIVYAAFDNHKNGDFKPYLFRGRDRGAAWEPIQGDLPVNGPVLAFAEDPVNPSLLFAGTEFGVFFTIDAGAHWTRLQGGLPTIPVRDIAIQPREKDLVIATFGRGFFVLDDYSALRTATPETLARDAVLFPLRDALAYVPTRPLGRGDKGWQGESYYTAPNPPAGVPVTYYLKETIQTARERRRAAEKEAAKKGEPIPYPTLDQLTREAREEAPAILFDVADASGKVVRRLTGPVTAGLHRIHWDLRAPVAVMPAPAGADDDDDGPPPSGPLVRPGRYTISMAKRIDGVVSALGESQSFNVTGESSTLEQSAAFQERLAQLTRAMASTMDTVRATRTKLDAIRRAVDHSAAPASLRTRAGALAERLRAISLVLEGDPEIRRRQENQPPSLSDRLGYIRFALANTTQPPTATHRENEGIVRAELEKQIATLRRLTETDLKKLEQDLESAGVAPTPGRLPQLR
ncbi:MAG: glycosyl hydrolase [Bryobacteraceae bacterium]